MADYFHDRGLKLGIYSSAGRSVKIRNICNLILPRHFCLRSYFHYQDLKLGQHRSANVHFVISYKFSVVFNWWGGASWSAPSLPTLFPSSIWCYLFCTTRPPYGMWRRNGCHTVKGWSIAWFLLSPLYTICNPQVQPLLGSVTPIPAGWSLISLIFE